MTENRHLSWEGFERLIQGGPPAVEAVRGEPKVEIFTDAGGTRIGVRTPARGAESSPSPLVEIDVRRRSGAEGDVVEISTENPSLYRDFYAFACAVADRLQVDELPVAAAVESALDAWASLLQRVTLLSDERQVGLMGELWLLNRLADLIGWTTAVDAWKGSDSEEHDFSWPSADVEVKTTLLERREHVIGSLTQLVPKGSTPLFVLSLQLTGAGAGSGQTLTTVIEDSRENASQESRSVLASLDARLFDAGWRPEHAPFYRRRFTQRFPAALVPVDERCPALTPDVIEGLGPDRVARLGQVVYRVDLTGLGSEDGSAEFIAVLPSGADS